MMRAMRTTVTLEPETERLLREAMRQRGQSFKEVLNRAIVLGLADLPHDARDPPFVPQTFPMGLRAGNDPAHLDTLGTDLEVDAFLGLSRRLGRRDASQ